MHERAGKAFRPSNGTEGDAFERRFCERCKHENAAEEFLCDLHFRALTFDTTDDAYPREWIYDHDGNPTCKAFALPGEPDAPKRCTETADLFERSPQ